MPYCYLIHFSEPIGNKDKARGMAQHYLGYTGRMSVEERLQEHLEGRGAKICKEAVKLGLKLKLDI